MNAAITFRKYLPDDYDMVSAWWKAHRGETAILPMGELPPLGMILELDGAPAAALWCYETYGTPVAFLEWPVSRPLLSLETARMAFSALIQAVVQAAGQSVEPPAEYTVFRALPDGPMSAFLKAQGFELEVKDRAIFPMRITLQPGGLD